MGSTIDYNNTDWTSTTTDYSVMSSTGTSMHTSEYPTAIEYTATEETTTETTTDYSTQSTTKGSTSIAYFTNGTTTLDYSSDTTGTTLTPSESATAEPYTTTDVTTETTIDYSTDSSTEGSTSSTTVSINIYDDYKFFNRNYIRLFRWYRNQHSGNFRIYNCRITYNDRGID